MSVNLKVDIIRQYFLSFQLELQILAKISVLLYLYLCFFLYFSVFVYPTIYCSLVSSFILRKVFYCKALLLSSQLPFLASHILLFVPSNVFIQPFSNYILVYYSLIISSCTRPWLCSPPSQGSLTLTDQFLLHDKISITGYSSMLCALIHVRIFSVFFLVLRCAISGLGRNGRRRSRSWKKQRCCEQLHQATLLL